ncbi:SOCS domain-containing protein stops [Cochliomyia hominivorax]
MEFIFECFYEDTLDKLCRNGLQDRSSRRDVLDHLNAIIGGCSDGQNMHTEEVARIAVLAAVRYHRDKKDNNGDVCLMGKFHNILYIALRTCWDWGVRDSAVVVVLLEEIYSCEKTFERIFLGALFGPNAPHFIAGWRSDFRDQDENTRAMVYFLHHATSLDMSLPVWIPRYEQERLVKFIDIPIESCGCSSPLRVALQASAPDLLLILLRYGAAPNPPDGGSSVVLALLDKLIENGRNYVYQNISCLQILLRNISHIEMPFKPIVLYNTRRDMFVERYGNLIRDNIIPFEQVFGVMSLRHLCRCRIRDLLRSNGQLPDGIDTLRLPRRLQRYIDLMEEIEETKDNNENEDNNDCNKKSRKKKNNENDAKNSTSSMKKKQVTFSAESNLVAKETDTAVETIIESTKTITLTATSSSSSSSSLPSSSTTAITLSPSEQTPQNTVSEDSLSTTNTSTEVPVVIDKPLAL